MSTYHIHGGKTLSGTVVTATSKNATAAILCAALMGRGVVTLTDVPQIQEVERFLELFASIGVGISRPDARTLVLDTRASLHMDTIHKKTCERTRASLMLLGALAAREKRYKLYKSGGCKLGSRTIKPHLFALEKFGVSVISRSQYYEVTNTSLHAADIVMYEAGDTPTENAIMAAVLAQGTTTIRFASANYMVQDLCYFLVVLGAKISGIGTTTITITGVKKLKSAVSYAIMPDPIEAFTWIALAAATKSPLTITNCPVDFLGVEMEKLRIMGQVFRITKKRVSKNGAFAIADIVMIPSALTALPDKISCQPFPGLNVDNLPLFGPILLAARGRTLMHDWMYENRAIYLLELQKMGGNVLLLDPHRIMFEGPSKCVGSDIVCPPAIRSGMAILITMLAAKGQSILRHAYPIDRAYEHVVDRLHHIGADITRSVESK